MLSFRFKKQTTKNVVDSCDDSNFSSRQIPKCFWKLAQETGTLLKEICGWDDGVIFLEKYLSEPAYLSLD